MWLVIVFTVISQDNFACRGAIRLIFFLKSMPSFSESTVLNWSSTSIFIFHMLHDLYFYLKRMHKMYRT